ncbi:MAG: phosphatase PAP2 family protein [Ferruginibacter sp.]
MWQSLFEEIIKIDKTVFFAINKYGNVSWLNPLMLLIRNQYTWIPLYIFVAYKVYKTNPNLLFLFFLSSLITFGLTDYTSANIIKPLVARLRPCYDKTTSSYMNLLLDCGGAYSFPSSHAANHFGLAMIWYRLSIFSQRKRWYWVWPWAAAIGYAQIYVGKHFPLDIIAGAILGTLLGLLVYSLLLLLNSKLDGKFNNTRCKH